jgi:hypothetical protein
MGGLGNRVHFFALDQRNLKGKLEDMNPKCKG